MVALLFLLFFFNDPATTEIYTLSLHDALPIWSSAAGERHGVSLGARCRQGSARSSRENERFLVGIADRKSTRLNSSHTVISYAVFCLKKKNKKKQKNTNKTRIEY